MAAPVQTGMDKAEMKKLLVKSKKEPVNCAIGVGDNNAFGLLMLDRIKAPKAVEKELVKEIPAAKNTRWGTAMVDPDEDPKLVKIIINKPISSMAKRLVKTLKGTGFTKVQILLEDGTSVEGAEEEDETAAAPASEGVPPPPPPPAAEKPAHDAAELARRLAALAARIPQASAGDAARQAELTKLATQANVNIKTNNLTYAAVSIEQLSKALDAAPPPAPPAPPPPQPAAPAQDAAALARALAALAPRIPQVAGEDAARRAALMKFATDANVNIKTNNLTYAAAAIEQLRRALDGAAPAASPEAPAASPAQPDEAKQKAREAAFSAGTYGKSGAVWVATRTKMQTELDKLRAAILAAYQGQAFVGEIEAKFSEKTAPVLQTLDTRLSDTLAGMANAADAEARSKLIDEAHEVIGEYRAYASNGLLADLDANPFAPVAIQSTVNATLTQLEKALA